MSKRAVKILVSTVLLWAAASVTERWTAETAAAQAAAVVALANAHAAAPAVH